MCLARGATTTTTSEERERALVRLWWTHMGQSAGVCHLDSRDPRRSRQHTRSSDLIGPRVQCVVFLEFRARSIRNPSVCPLARSHSLSSAAAAGSDRGRARAQTTRANERGQWTTPIDRRAVRRTDGAGTGAGGSGRFIFENPSNRQTFCTSVRAASTSISALLRSEPSAAGRVCVCLSLYVCECGACLVLKVVRVLCQEIARDRIVIA